MEFYSDSSTETLSAVQLWYTHTSKQGTERVKESGSIKKLKHTRITVGRGEDRARNNFKRSGR